MMYVICKETMTSPAPAYEWMPPNLVCGTKCEVVRPAPVMDVWCPHGHRFLAALGDVVYEGDER